MNDRERPEIVDEPFEPYDVTCARCGKVLSCLDAVIEEGDEWECPPCNERCNAQERMEHDRVWALRIIGFSFIALALVIAGLYVLNNPLEAP